MLLKKRQQGKRTKKNTILQTNHRKPNLFVPYLSEKLYGLFSSLLLVWNQFIFAHVASILKVATGCRLGSRDPCALSLDDALNDF